MKRTGIHQGRDRTRNQYWPNDDPWLGPAETAGWFAVSRTLPLLLTVLDSKAVSGKHKPSRTYLELLSRHWGEGIIVMKHEGQHSYAAGHGRIRTWRDHMEVLEREGFIKTIGIGAQQYTYVFLVHPTAVVENLRLAKKITDPVWLRTYEEIQRESKELTFEERNKKKTATAKILPIRPGIKKKRASVHRTISKVGP